MSIPKARPAGWWVKCWCGTTMVVRYRPPPNAWHGLHTASPFHCMALWGEQWADLYHLVRARSLRDDARAQCERQRLRAEAAESAFASMCASYIMKLGKLTAERDDARAALLPPAPKWRRSTPEEIEHARQILRDNPKGENDGE